MRATFSLALGLLCAACGDDERARELAAVEAELQRTQSKVAALEKELDKKRARTESEPMAQDPVGLGQTVAVELARSKSDRPQSGTKVVSVTADAIYFADERVTLEQLQQRLQALAAADPEASLVMRVSDDVAHARVIEMMDRAKQAGINRFAVAATSDDEAGDRSVPEPSGF
jgi:biopolymer transport protein ExbD